MDIRRWLDDTADREPPDVDVPPSSLQPPDPQNLPARPPRRDRRKRQRASSDSSIIVPQQCHGKRSRRQPRVQAHSSTPSAVENACGAEGAGADAYSSSVLDDPKPSVDAVHEHAYTRKARHKTNPGRYEPKSRKQRKEPKARKDSRSRPRHRKSHRSGDGGRATGLVQSFQLKNGPKGGRLTLKPETTTGLFKHGRASAQVAGRGGGLPDLAFNEMRFLQKPKDHQDAVSGNQAAKGPTKKDRKHAQDEEISAYFAAQRRDPDGKQQDPSRIGSRQHRRKDSPIRARQASPPPVELPEKPFLGFGSKGTQQDPSHKHDQSTSHYSWSESAAPARAEEGNAPILNAAFATEKPGETESVTSKPEIPSSDRASEKSVAQDESLDASRKRESLHQSQPKKRSTLRETDVAPLSVRLKDDEARRSTTKTTCQSLPHQIQETRSQDPPRSRGDMSCHTSDILKVRQPNTLITKSIFDGLIGLAAVGDDDKENKQPDSSSPTGKLLKRARDALSLPTVTPVKIRQGHHSANAGLNVEDQLRDTGGLHMPERRLQYFRGDDTAFGQKGRQYQRPNLEQRIFRGPTGQQIGDLQCGMAEPLLRFQNMSSDAEMLDNGNDAAPLELYDSYVYADAEKNDELGQTWQFERSTGFLGSREQSQAPVSRLSGGRTQTIAALPDTGRARAIRELSIETDNGSLRPPTLGAVAEAGNTEIDDGLAGFWKPHRLY
ncbi:hypothetical protein D0864_06630 [Hortaea werneckii]|uniref:Uncharacterized protein n=1 Tax=Hortaea werneckii TaxID=91943 RepID=A0A3M7FHY0_HORWE|nr:hypothetical protein KC323_g5915 [Hortaea werneckii]KAI7201359.1 hypothetical protein KC352_g19381 [Hortaea werneckii]KAI7350054.1 hypothetical protein KC320_g5720 [Hortaea werneckii]KAI7663314.1 hypothetical protein KC319_g7808 [Hortaea werneckii]KAI7702941.1 hypothetical protein KC322_g7271 [Hortaea werneckii]